MIKAILMDFNGVIIDDERIQLDIIRGLLDAEGVAITESSTSPTSAWMPRFVAGLRIAGKTPGKQVLRSHSRKYEMAGTSPVRCLVPVSKSSSEKWHGNSRWVS